MVEQRTKQVSKNVAAAKTKPKTSTAVSGKTKTAIAAVSTTAKKVVAKKTETAVAETKKTKPPAVKKVSKTAAEIKAPTKKAAAKGKPSTAAKRTVADPTPEERYRMVETAAYYIAEQRGFQGRSDEHWAAAECEIAAKLGQ